LLLAGMGAAASTAGLSDSTQKALDGMPESAKTELGALLAKQTDAKKAADPAEAAAATKMQAIQRGNLQRNEAAGIEKWGKKVFEQFDTDKNGKLSCKELTRALKSLPKTKPVSAKPGTKYMSVDDMVKAMDENADGEMDLKEWLKNLAKCAGLYAALIENVNEEGKMASFRSFEEQKKKREGEVAALEAKETRTPEEDKELEEYKKEIESLGKKIEEANENAKKAAAEATA
jgi:molecular chaperone DnaK (HSP70)